MSGRIGAHTLGHLLPVGDCSRPSFDGGDEFCKGDDSERQDTFLHCLANVTQIQPGGDKGFLGEERAPTSSVRAAMERAMVSDRKWQNC